MYIFPSIDLLKESKQNSKCINYAEETKQKLQCILTSFKVHASVGDFILGSRVTQYEVLLDQGVNIKKITNLSENISLGLGVASVRVVQIVGKPQTVGIEVPNLDIEVINLKSILQTEGLKGATSKTKFGIGRNIKGDTIMCDLAEMPHLIIAGTTGSGKSVLINNLITSLLYKASPNDVKLILIDPKMVELSGYNGIPHLLAPVITDPNKAIQVLDWVVREMENRYRLMELKGVRNLQSYNKVSKKQLPKIVIIIDELADLMMVSGKKVEGSICRIAQMARAAGIHLVVATQRPDREIITGLIKANIPSRIAFTVSSAINSRLILDESGAEKLLGKGDILYKPVGAMNAIRLQGVFLTDEEIENVVEYVKKKNNKCDYQNDIMELIDERRRKKVVPGSLEYFANYVNPEYQAACYKKLCTALDRVIV